MFTQITVIKINDAADIYKVTLFDTTGVVYSEKITGYTETKWSIETALQQLHRHPRSTYAES